MIKMSKVVASLPSQEFLEKDCIYFVKIGAGFDLYVTNHVGSITVAYQLNLPTNGGTSVKYKTLPIGTIVYIPENQNAPTGFVKLSPANQGTYYLNKDLYPSLVGILEEGQTVIPGSTTYSIKPGIVITDSNHIDERTGDRAFDTKVEPMRGWHTSPTSSAYIDLHLPNPVKISKVIYKQRTGEASQDIMIQLQRAISTASLYTSIPSQPSAPNTLIDKPMVEITLVSIGNGNYTFVINGFTRPNIGVSITSNTGLSWLINSENDGSYSLNSGGGNVQANTVIYVFAYDNNDRTIDSNIVSIPIAPLTENVYENIDTPALLPATDVAVTTKVISGILTSNTDYRFRVDNSNSYIVIEEIELYDENNNYIPIIDVIVQPDIIQNPNTLLFYDSAPHKYCACIALQEVSLTDLT